MEMNKSNIENLTEPSFWENYWDNREISPKKKRQSLLIIELLDLISQKLPKVKGLNILEIGGGSGEYLLHLVKTNRYNAHSLDYSAIGNEQTLRSFSKAMETVVVYERDLFGQNLDLPRFDIVFSLGLIEHFENTDLIVQKHLEFVKPGGILLLGVPNYAGIYKPILNRLAPSVGQTHYFKVMNLNEWETFENKFELDILFKDYIGGFEPLNMKKIEVKTPLNKFIYLIIKILMVLFSFRFRFLRKFNSKWWSSYMIGIYMKK